MSLEGHDTWKHKTDMNEILSRKRPVGSPKKKTLEYDTLQFEYDYQTDMFRVTRLDSKETFFFSKPEIEELRLALSSLVTDPSQINYRGTVPRD